MVTEYASLNITTFRIIVVSFDAGIANVFDLMQLECVCIPISTV